MTIDSSFKSLATQLNGFSGTVIALDPGETTGFAILSHHQLIMAGQFPSGSVSLAWNNCMRLMLNVIQGGADYSWDHDPQTVLKPFVPIKEGIAPKGKSQVHDEHNMVPHHTRGDASQNLHVVIEDYRIYSFKADDHKFSNVFTVKVLTCYEILAHLYGLPVKLTMAHAVKAFCTDAKLKSWTYWPRGQRHARDAIRHGCYYILEEALTKPQTQQARQKPTFQN